MGFFLAGKLHPPTEGLLKYWPTLPAWSVGALQVPVLRVSPVWDTPLPLLQGGPHMQLALPLGAVVG